MEEVDIGDKSDVDVMFVMKREESCFFNVMKILNKWVWLNKKCSNILVGVVMNRKVCD